MNDTSKPNYHDMSAEDLFEELSDYDVPDDLWGEIAIRLGVEGANGVRAANTWMPQSKRLRAYIEGRQLAERQTR